MMLARLLSLTIVPGVLAACATSEQPSATAATQPVRSRSNQQLQMQLASGLYRCELGQSVEVHRDPQSTRLLELQWQGNRHKLQRQDSSSGLPRYEDPQNGLLWIDLPWKSILMDAKSGRPLANECKLAQSRTTRS